MPSNLGPLREIVGDGALDYTLVIGSFHFINRIADLLHVDPEGLPEPLRRFELLRRLFVRLAGMMMAKMDLANREYPFSYEEDLETAASLFEGVMGRNLKEDFAPLKSRPKVIEVIKLALEERDTRSNLDRETLARVHRTVEAALPTCIDEAQGFHTRPQDPVEDFAFVGTRYAYRTTKEMIDALRQASFDDISILDLAIAVAEANQWARIHRLVGLKPGLFYISN
jgi:hypothetical protein